MKKLEDIEKLIDSGDKTEAAHAILDNPMALAMSVMGALETGNYTAAAQINALLQIRILEILHPAPSQAVPMGRGGDA